MTKLFKLETTEEFKIMEDVIRKFHNIKELNEELFNELQVYEENGFYSPLSEDAFYTIPIGERWYTKYDITYHMSVLLLKYYLSGHEEVYDQLMKTIHACISKNYMGHSYDGHSVRVNSLIQLYENGISQLFENEKYLSHVLSNMVDEYRFRLSVSATVDGFADLKNQIIQLLKIVDKDLLFVYGTLMENETNSFYLNSCKKIGDADIEGYNLIDTGGYPGMIQGSGIVLGELYSITDEVKFRIDKLEGSQYSYKSDFVYVNDVIYYANFYQFEVKRNKDYSPCMCINNRWINSKNYVWYACYGSNLLDERFAEYLSCTSSKANYIASEAITLPFNLYFAKNSTRWNYEGVAFLDVDKKDETLGWKYLITKEQFKEIQSMEGSWYSNKIFIETDEYGIDTYTFTSPTKYEEVKPSDKYLNVIKNGLKEKYNLEDTKIDKYLNARIDNK